MRCGGKPQAGCAAGRAGRDRQAGFAAGRRPGLAGTPPSWPTPRDISDRRTSFFSQHRQKQPWQKTADKDFFFRGLKICLHEQFFRSEHLFTAKSVLNAAKFALKRTLLPGKIVFRSFGSEILFLKSDRVRQREKNLVRCFREGKISALSRKTARKTAEKTARDNFSCSTTRYMIYYLSRK